MAVVTLLPRYYVKVPVNVHAKLFTIFSNVTIQLEAEHTVDVFVIDDNGLKAFESGQPYFWRYYNQPNVSALTISLSLPIPQGQLAWVVIQSKEHQYTALYYNVS